MLFFELLQVAVGRRDRLSFVPSRSEWRYLFQLSEQHAVLGVAYCAVRRLPREQWPSEDILIDWVWQAQRIVERNALVSARSVEVCERLKQEEMDVCLLKGQGNALNYGEMASYRQAGDIDIWVIPHDRPEHHPKRRVIDFVQRRFPDVLLRYHHIEYPVFGDEVEVEIHFVPIYLNNYALNRRLYQYIRVWKSSQMCHRVALAEGEVAVPTAQFNALFQLLHIYKHVFEEGLGLRQLMDYYFVLCQLHAEGSAQDRDELRQMIGRLHIESLAGAVMYVMQEVFGAPTELLPYPADKDEGVALLSDMMQAGNFGHFDTRYEKELHQEGWPAMLHRYWRKTKRNLILAIHYPHEALWEPWFRLYHFFWRTFKLWKI